MNKVIQIGRIVNDPEARTTQNGIANTNFRIAVTRKYKNAQGQHDSDFFNVVTWRQTAEYVSKYLHKGDKVAIEGALQSRSYDAQDGSKRTVVEIVADSVESLAGRKEAASSGAVEAPDEKLPWEV